MPLQNTPNHIIQPTKASLIACEINGVPFIDRTNGGLVNYFHVQELRIFEDNCKFYFTAQLVIEASQNTFELYLKPKAPVKISFMAPPNSKIYTENFKVYSYESKPREGDIENSMVITIALLGEEYFKDKAEQVQLNVSNQIATHAIEQIHRKYLSTNGGLDVFDSLGMIGEKLHPHQILSKAPSKAIHDLLDKAIFPVPSSGPGVYFRNKDGYVVAPLEHLIKNAPITGNFLHVPAGGASEEITLTGYDKVINFRPMAPPGEDRTAASRGEQEGLNSVPSFIDLAKGISKTGQGTTGNGYGNISKYIADTFRQNLNVDKNGPGKFKSKEDAFITKLTYSPKYWTSVPLQTGIDVTVGDRIRVTYPISGQAVDTHTMWVARLIHELRFTEGKDRREVTVNGTTDIFGVVLGG